jgi:hypothetical protein
MRKVPVIALLLAATSCGQAPQEERQTQSENLTTYDVAEPPPPPSSVSAGRAGGPPSIGPTAAPGVAFNYRYAFRLAGDRIARVQEEHAAACEKLGIARCRITGMRYRLVGERDIEGMLAFKLDPSLARRFGKEGIDAVTRAEGMLVDAEVSGEDAGAKIAAALRSEGALGDRLKAVEAQLARAKSGSERAELQVQAEQLREQMQGTRAVKIEQRESLATTPVVFEYGSGDLVPGLDGRSRLKLAGQHALDNLVGGALWIAVALITLLPWLLLAALAWWVWRRVWPRLARPAAPEVYEAPVTPPEA